MKKYFNLNFHLKTVLKIFIFTFIICSVALLLTSIIPDQKIDDNIEKSIEKMNKEGEYPHVLGEGTKYYQFDNFSEAALLNFIYTCDADKPLNCTYAQTNYVGRSTGLQNANLMIKETSPHSTYHGVKEGHYLIRSSYWLGSRIFITPLLLFMDYYFVRYIYMSIAIFFAIFTIIKLAEKTKWLYGVALGGTLVVTNYFLGIFAAPNAFIYILTFAAMDYLLLTHKKVNYFHFMFLIGMLTSYFDWFTIPLITWGFSTITLLIIEYQKNKKIQFYEIFNIIFRTAIAWCLGYASMLLFRIIFSYLVAGSAAINYFTERVSTNTGMKSESIIINAYNAIINCLNGLLFLKINSKLDFLLFAGIVGLIVIAISFYLMKRKIKIGIPFAIISLAPFAWIVAFNKFHAVHWWFAYRVLGIFVFSLLVLLLIFVDEVTMQLKKNQNIKKLVKKLSNANVIRFLIVGGISTLIDYLIYMIISLNYNLILSKCMSMLIACIFSFFANKQWTFKNNEKKSLKMILSFIIVQIINIGLNSGINYLMYSYTNSRTIAFIIATFIAMIVNYLLQKTLVFKGGKK